ncbi:MAG: hypothetical protein AAFN92_15755, partial [Bacteroidota bacterium]
VRLGGVDFGAYATLSRSPLVYHSLGFDAADAEARTIPLGHPKSNINETPGSSLRFIEFAICFNLNHGDGILRFVMVRECHSIILSPFVDHKARPWFQAIFGQGIGFFPEQKQALLTRHLFLKH